MSIGAGFLPSMNPAQWWKNFDLNAEVHIAGTFLYDGMQSLGHCRRTDNDDELFSVLYHLSVGLERLMKVVIVLSEHTDKTDQETFEKDLVTHNTVALLERIRKAHPKIEFVKREWSLANCLAVFYGVYRYDHFRLETIRNRGQFREAFRAFLEKDSGITLSGAGEFIPTDDIPRIRKHVDKVVRTLAVKLFHLVEELARKDNIYTYELRSGSKASMILTGVEHTFETEETALKELLLYLLLRHRGTKLSVVTENLRPLELDPPDAVDWIDAFSNPDKREMLVSMVNTLRKDINRKDLKERDKLLELLGPEANLTCTDKEALEMGATDEDLRKLEEEQK